MTHHRIAVGLDGSTAAHRALAWAADEAQRRGASLLVVTAWPGESRAVARAGGTLPTERRRLQRMQRHAIASATAALAGGPPVLRELVFGEPVTALCHAASRADLLVLGTDGRPPAESVGAAVTRRLNAHGHGAAVKLVPAPAWPAHPGAA
jgi:nucleotide-binding universal stress UspA family protein